MSDNRDGSRLRQRLNPLLTSLGNFSQNANTPVSALSYSSNSYNASTPASAIQPYNPQQWLPSPIPGPGPERGHQLRTPDSNGSPLPPPPYSPPRSQRPVSMYLDGSQNTNMTLSRTPLPTIHRPSPETPNNPSFPPPPNGRGSSRERRFGFPSLSRRREPDQTISPDAFGSGQRQAVGSSSTRPNPLSIQIPAVGLRRNEDNPSPSGLPPAARRAASTGSIDTPTSARSRSASQSRWDPAVPFPPPPPGPPPRQSRSQSTSREYTSETQPMVSPPTRRPPPTGVTALGPVPPTPANWVDEDRTSTQPQAQEHLRQASPPLNTGLPLDRNASVQEPTTSSPSHNALLNRTNAQRSDKPLKERRNESRTRSSRLSIDAPVSNLDDIVIPSLAGGLTRRTTFGKTTPRSAGQPQRTPGSGELTGSDKDDENSGSTPRASDSSRRSPGMEVSTPPFSPQPLKAHTHGGPSSLVPKALPTPPPRSGSASRSITPMGPDGVIPTPLTSKSVVLARELATRQNSEQFSHDTIERFGAFAQKEAKAADDAERVRLFAEFIVGESRIRRERYATAISAMGSEIFDLTRDLFRPMTSRRESTASQGSEWTPQSSEPNRSHRGSIGSIHRGELSKPGEPTSGPPSASAVPLSPGGPPAGSANYNSNFQPSLSPILSMSVSDRRDDDSRGRPASRWWESISSGESTKWERSKRESKYMSVPKEAREALQWLESPVGDSGERDLSNEYPPEKQGWHDSPADQAFQQTYSNNPVLSALKHPISLPNTPNPNHLDVSRLVTLPPPYPRHHPAVNNNHPELAEIRASTRTLSDLSEVDATKSRFNHDSRVMHDEAVEAANKRRQALRKNLQEEVGLGRMTYAEAAAIEADSSESEKQASKDLEKKDFDRFQTDVVVPLNELLTSRITKATMLFDELRSRLFVETREPNPNMPQEEGDEHPELLEKLTLLKWIFETREVLHRAVYDLLSDRNDRYREMVITPYRLAGNEEKMAHASAFFAEDASRRALAFANDIYKRTSDFRDVVEQNVVRGVEVQLSAFWDIAPPLCRLLDRVPLEMSSVNEEGESSIAGGHGRSLADFRIQIPQAEIVENPSYVDHPLQYLFSLLLHAEKSTYQFIENQTNLFCLLHEVNEAVLVARARLMEEEGGTEKDAVEGFRQAEGQRLTDELKEKVRVVQEQWRSGLGERVGHVKERVGEWLLETGGWDESLEDRGVGSL
ncbi:hypothetical protein N0V93_002335 [Gnomoniopsis smithogilvyi]|uniref:Uncharacterized protein n=1 Tax=Gnomoniopsis smithogilvyi TaxID=1191159 RepID=A0A9W8YWG0_9PEZI|nr:hypothetical protein N0V93_002335 [Gnomoniopsis smithogilvyi]